MSFIIFISIIVNNIIYLLRANNVLLNNMYEHKKQEEGV